MKKLLISIILTLLLSSCQDEAKKKTILQPEASALLIIDAQKWYIPGHKESLYEKWNIKGHDRLAQELISSMDSVLTWANSQSLPVFVTYESSDTAQYDLPLQLKQNLDSNRTTHFVKQYYAALKHKEFETIIENSKIKNWFIIGAETDVCVYQTVKELLKRGMNVTLIPDAIYSGRNNTEVALSNLQKFGASTLKIKELSTLKDLFKKGVKKVEEPISYKNTQLFIKPLADSLKGTGEYTRLEYLKSYAKIIGMPTKLLKTDSVIEKDTSKTILLAGDISEKDFQNLSVQGSDNIILVADCIPNHKKHSTVKHRKATLKIVFYELMETFAFYVTDADKLEDWQKKLKTAMDSEELSYVESSQNL